MSGCGPVGKQVGCAKARLTASVAFDPEVSKPSARSEDVILERGEFGVDDLIELRFRDRAAQELTIDKERRRTVHAHPRASGDVLPNRSAVVPRLQA